MMEWTEEQKAEISRLISERINQEKIKREELEATLAQFKTENDNLKAEAAELPVLRRNALIQQVAQELGLPERFALRIKGDTKEDMVADATQLKADLEADAELTALDKVGLPFSPTGGGQPKVDRRQAAINHMKELPSSKNLK